MKCQGKFKFRGIEKKDGGEFINDKGQKIVYKERYSLKLDECTEKGINERLFNIAIDNPIIADLLKLKPYDDIVLDFDLVLSNNRISLNPIAILK